MTLKLRPHHLLCTQAYHGMGYSKGFLSNMDEVIRRLRQNPDEQIEIVFSADSICGDCPSKEYEESCKSDEKVFRYDRAVIEILNLSEDTYSYQELISELDEYLSLGKEDERMKAICGDCAWYHACECWKYIKK